jgi:2'-5' RNA ligase
MPRLFVALDLPVVAKRELEKAQQYLRKAHERSVKWVETANMHLTLLFLGEVADALVPQIKTALHAAGWRSSTAILLPQLSLASVGAYRSFKEPKTIWMGVTCDSDALTTLYQVVVAAMHPLGFAPDHQRFHPHLTLGRVRRDLAPSTLAAIGKTLETCPTPAPVPWQSEEPVLFESILRPAGPIYRKISY